MLRLPAGNENHPLNGMMPAACDGVIAVTAISQGNGSIDYNQGIPPWTNFLNLDPNSPDGMTDYKYNLTVAAPGTSIQRSTVQTWGEACMVAGGLEVGGVATALAHIGKL
jgi:hypothetical protein